MRQAYAARHSSYSHHVKCCTLSVLHRVVFSVSHEELRLSSNTAIASEHNFVTGLPSSTAVLTDLQLRRRYEPLVPLSNAAHSPAAGPFWRGGPCAWVLLWSAWAQVHWLLLAGCQAPRGSHSASQTRPLHPHTAPNNSSFTILTWNDLTTGVRKQTASATAR